MSKIKTILESGRRTDALIQSDLEELSRLRAMLTAIPSPTLGDTVQSSRTGDGFTALLDRIMETEARINEEIDMFLARKEQIRGLIASLSVPEEQLCLKLRYIDGDSWAAIAEKMAYSERQIYRLHDKALRRLEAQETAGGSEGEPGALPTIRPGARHMDSVFFPEQKG